MNYKIAEAQSEDLECIKVRLEKAVNSLMAKGYKPQGGVLIATKEMIGHTAWYIAFQAMIKE